MKIAIGMRRVDHLPYIDCVLKELKFRGHDLSILMDDKYFNEREIGSIKTKFQKSGVKVQEFLAIEQDHQLIRIIKRLLGVLIYKVDSEFDKDYLTRQLNRSRLQQLQGLFESVNAKVIFRLSVRILRWLAQKIHTIVGNKMNFSGFDLLLVSPGNLLDSVEDTLILAAKQRKIPTAVIALSLDNLNSKGTVVAIPDIYFAWNNHHSRLLLERHLLPAKNLFISGSPYFEKYAIEKFEESTFVLNNIISSDMVTKPIIGYLGSSGNVSKDEHTWLQEKLDSCPELLERYFIVIRPHPANFDIWKHWNYVGTVVFPQAAELLERNPVESRDFFESCEFTFGINTSGFLDSIACGTPVFTVTNLHAHFQHGASHYKALKRSGIGEVSELNQFLNLIMNKNDIAELLIQQKSMLLPNYGNVANTIVNKCESIMSGK